tara:strand:- start:761 stop:1273 length:513 start_codon:yes stop_codon:yes gene_type:complete
MKKIILVINILFSMFYFNSTFAEEKSNNKNTQLNFYTGMFDFSDHGQKAMLFGIQHQNEDLQRKTFLGNLSPITGGFFTENSAVYLYSGVEWNFDLGKINFTPSFAPGLYGEGDGKDLGHILEFKTEVQASLDISKNSSFGVSYNHISNASLGDKNPGANNYTFNFLKKF